MIEGNPRYPVESSYIQTVDTELRVSILDLIIHKAVSTGRPVAAFGWK